MLFYMTSLSIMGKGEKQLQGSSDYTFGNNQMSQFYHGNQYNSIKIDAASAKTRTENHKMTQSTQVKVNASLFDNYDDMVTVGELAEMLRIGRNTAYELVRAGIIPSLKIGRRQIRISKPAVIDYISSAENEKH